MPWPIAPASFLLAQEAPNKDGAVQAFPGGEMKAFAEPPAKAAAPAPAKADGGEAVAAAPAGPATKTGSKAAPVPAPAAEGGLPQILLFAPIIVMFYLLLIRPQQKQEKQRKSMIDALKKNDKVLTSAGIYGTVVSVDPANDKVVVRVDDDKGVKFTFSKASISRVVEPQAEKEKEKASEPSSS